MKAEVEVAESQGEVAVAQEQLGRQVTMDGNFSMGFRMVWLKSPALEKIRIIFRRCCVSHVIWGSGLDVIWLHFQHAFHIIFFHVSRLLYQIHPHTMHINPAKRHNCMALLFKHRFYNQIIQPDSWSFQRNPRWFFVWGDFERSAPGSWNAFKWRSRPVEHPSWEKWPGFQIWEDFPWIFLGWHGKNPPNPICFWGFPVFQTQRRICVPLARPQKCEKKEQLIKDLRDEIEEQQLESSQAFMNLGWTFWSNIDIWFAKLYPAMFDTNSKCCLGDATWLLWNLSCDNLHNQRLVKKTKVAVKLSSESDVTSRNKWFWNLHLKPFSGRKQVKVNRCLVGNLKEVRSASLPFRKASSLGIGWGEYWPWNGILFRQEGWSFPSIPPWKWTNDECSLKKGTISKGKVIFQPSILKGHVSFRRSNAKPLTPPTLKDS